MIAGISLSIKKNDILSHIITKYFWKTIKSLTHQFKNTYKKTSVIKCK